MKKILKSFEMIVHGKLALLVLGVLLFVGMTGCNQADEAMEEVSQASKEAVEMLQDKTGTAMDNEEEENDDASSDKDDKESDEE